MVHICGQTLCGGCLCVCSVLYQSENEYRTREKTCSINSVNSQRFLSRHCHLRPGGHRRPIGSHFSLHNQQLLDKKLWKSNMEINQKYTLSLHLTVRDSEKNKTKWTVFHTIPIRTCFRIHISLCNLYFDYDYEWIKIISIPHLFVHQIIHYIIIYHWFFDFPLAHK